MNIKRLEIFGFKSFKNKTVLEFDQDLTGIVGPNGCGKSNIVDALLWVMGEGAPKNLRSPALANVIFSGTSQYPAGSFTEVSLLLEKGEIDFPEKYKDFSELMITRRCEREGESECFINRTPCRLKDIKEVFMDTGAGCRGFSIIEQEAVEKLITAKPKERRLIIEEVAGIAKFRNRKGESLRKLAQVQENLQRLNDILKTQETQLKQLSRQVKAAEKYRNIKKEIRDKETELCCRAIESIETEEQKLEQSLSECRKIQEKLKVKKQEIQSRIHLTQKNLKDSETLLEKEKNYLSELEFKTIEQEKEAEKREATVKIYRESLENHSSSHKSLFKDMAGAKEKITDIENQIKELNEKENKKKEELKALENSSSELEHLRDLRGRKEELDTEIQKHKSEKSEWAVKSGILESQIRFIKKEIEKALLKKQELDLQIQKFMKEKTDRSSHLEKCRQLQNRLIKDKELFLKNSKAHEEKKNQTETEINRLRQNTSLLSYKIEESGKLVNHFEGPNEGTLSLLQWKPGEFKPLIKNITVEPGFETAVQVALDNHLYALLTENEHSVKESIDYLKQNKKGKAGFLFTPTDMEPNDTLEKESLRSFPAFVCFLNEKITFSVKTEALFRLARRTVVVSNFYSALDLKSQFPDFQFVTKEGDFISRDHLIYGGSYENKTNIFKIKNTIEHLSEELKSDETTLSLKESDLKQTLQLLAGVNFQLSFTEKKEKEILNTIQSQEKDEGLMEKEVFRLTEEKDLLSEKQESLEEEKNQLSKELSEVEEKSRSENEVIKTKENILNSIKERLDNLENVRTGKHQMEMELFSMKKDQETKQKEINFIRDFLQQSSTKKSGFLKTEENLKASIEREESLLKEIKKECELHKEEKSQMQSKCEAKEKAFLGKKESLLKYQQDLSESEKKKEQSKEEAYNMLLKKEKQDIQKQNLKDKLLKDYQMNWDRGVFIPKYEALSSEELEIHLDRLQRELAKTGEVNLIALKEYETLLENNLFLTKQREDLLNSKKELFKIISHVDKLCHKRFEARLEEINFRFSRIFPIVFEGEDGEARLVLSKGEEEGEEAGVEIMARPPGKKLQNVSLLSRGEKALTAICLVYSLFLVKPSPFCVLDEVDAPLDDANNLRFLSILKQMSRRSRVLVITHNKRTMEVCESLYGVTMEEPGVSQIVSVDLRKSEDSPLPVS